MGLEIITTGRVYAPPRVLIYGPEGIGKSTAAAAFPSPVFIQTEDGLNEIDTTKFPLCASFGDVLAHLESLASEQHEYRTVVIDTLDWTERLIWSALCAENGKANIEDFGYGKGYTYALGKWSLLIDSLAKLRSGRGMAICLICHCKIERFESPDTASWDRYTLRLHKAATDIVSQWVDVIAFATRNVVVTKERKERMAAKASPIIADDTDRVLRFRPHPSYVAKTRYKLPDELPLDGKTFVSALS